MYWCPSKWKCGACAWLLCVGLVSWGEVAGQGLREILDAAYRHNPALDAARAGFQASAERLPQARAEYLPSVGVAATQRFSRTVQHTRPMKDGQSTIKDLDESQQPSSVSLSMRVNLFNGGASLAAVHAAEAEVAAARWDLDATEQEVLFRTTEAYATVVLGQRLVALAEEARGELEQLRQWVDEMFRHRQTTATYVAAVRSRQAGARSDLAVAQARLAGGRARLESLAGIAVGRLEVWPELPEVPATLDGAVSAALDANPGLARSQYTLAAVEQEVRRRKAELWPRIDLQAGFDLEWNSARFTGSDDYKEFDRESNWNVGLTLQLPLFSGGRNLSRIREAQYAAAQSRGQLHDTRARLRAAVMERWGALDAARRSVAARADQVAAAEAAYRGYRRQFEAGTGTTFQDILNAHYEWIQAKQALAQARHEAFTTQAELLTVIGWFDARRLDLGPAPFDLEDHAASARNRIQAAETSR